MKKQLKIKNKDALDIHVQVLNILTVLTLNKYIDVHYFWIYENISVFLPNKFIAKLSYYSYSFVRSLTHSLIHSLIYSM